VARVKLDHVYKYYGQVQAVIDLNIDIKENEVFALLGPSGCGKSSTLRMIAGLEEITRGKIYIGNRCVNSLSPQERNIALVFENYALYPHMSVFENIAFPLIIRKFPFADIKSKVQKVAEMLEIENVLKSNVRDLSGGQQQRVSLGRAIVRNPLVLLMDEPISHLDIELRARMRGKVRELIYDIGTSCVYVTHDQLEALAIADRIAVMNLGRVQQIGTPFEIFNRPRNQFVAEFIGESPMNFLDCIIKKKDGNLFLQINGWKLALPQKIAEKLMSQSIAKKLLLGIRPEDIRISNQKSGADVLDGEVILCREGADKVTIEVKIGENHIIAEMAPPFSAKEGEIVAVSLDMEKINVFDKKTGFNLLT